MNSSKSNKKGIIMSLLIISSVFVVFVDILYPLTSTQTLVLRTFDLAVVVILVLDYVARLRSSTNKRKFFLRHLYELPAMIPLFLTGAADSASFLRYIQLIALFRIIRLYNIMSYVDGSELIILASMSAICIIFGGFAVFIFEAPAPDSNIETLPDSMWWSIETITTVAYGEYYPVTPEGKVVASVMMFAAIAFLWTFVGALGSRFAEKRAAKRGETQNSTSGSDSDNPNSVVDDTKTMVKKRIDRIGSLEEKDFEALITIIRTLYSNEKAQ
ncbi:MAG: ion transporter [Nitrososphaeraceae archaeon]